MAKTPNYNLELPDESRNISEEFPVLRDNLTLLDAALKEQSDAVESKAPEKHQHKIDEVEGLLNALNGKMSANKTFALTNLMDVKGANEAAVNYVLTKMATGFGFSSAIAVLGPHQHKIEDIKGLEDVLSKYGHLDNTNVWKGENKFYANVTISGSDRQQNRQYPYLKVRFPDGESPAGGMALVPDAGGRRTELGYQAGGGIRITIEADTVAKFTTSGDAYFKNTIHCGETAQYQADGNITGTAWEPWGAKDALAAIDKRIEERATAIADERQKWCVTDTRFIGWFETPWSSWDSRWNHLPSGYVATGAFLDVGKLTLIGGRQPQVYYPGRGWVPLGGW